MRGSIQLSKRYICAFDDDLCPGAMDAAIAPLPDCGICPQFVAYTCVAPISSTLPSLVFLECEENLPARPLMDCAGGFAGENGLDNHGFRERRFMATSNAAASKSGLYADPRRHRLAPAREEIIDPQRPIVEPPSPFVGSRQPALPDRRDHRRHRL